MAKHINMKVKCFGCNKDFMTAKLKHEGEAYNCPHCNHEHMADLNEVDDCWLHTDAYDLN
jgi:DNA-directed RNA polymerase subunit RPC12/RpoP